SYQLFNDLKNVRMADDVVFQLKTESAKHQTNSIIISVIKPSFREELKNYDKIYYEKIKEIAIGFIRKGYEITLISFCEYEGDKDAIDTIIASIPAEYKENIKTHLYKYNIEETLKVISTSRFIVATRFHSMVLGWLFKKAVYPIAYSDKMINVMKDINFTGPYTEFENLNRLQAEQVINSMYSKHIDISKQVMGSEKHFKILDKYLRG